MTDDPVRTYVLTEDGEIPFQEYFTTLGCEPVVTGFKYAGAEEAMLTQEVSDALDSPDLEAVVICPANPYHTIRPILEIPGMRELMRKRGAPVIAVTPIVGGKALKGSAGKIMRELRHEASARRVALEYLKLIDGFVIDSEDQASAADVRAAGMEVLVANTVMRTPEDRTALARAVLAFAQTIRERRLQEA
jgi:LPPG:FO 2-phospho-L-lactate transferase